MFAAEIALTGRVVDESDVPVAAAQLYFSQASEAGTRRSLADKAGAFSITLPGPGDYLVDVQHEGYFELKHYKLHVDDPGQAVVLVLSPVREVFQAVNVNESPSPVDVDRTDNRKTLSGTEVVDIPYPATRSLRNAMRLFPGTLLDSRGGLHFQGALENQVEYVLNGFDISDPITGRLRTRLSVEAVRALEFQSARFSPEMGKGSAGVLSIRTDSGSDQFRYTATNFIPGVDFRNGMHVGDWSPRFGFSGPIYRGKAWFSDSFDAGYNQTFVNGLPKGSDQRWGAGGSNLLHTQWNLSPSNLLFSDFLINVDRQYRSGLAPLDPVSTTTTQRFQNVLWSLKDQFYTGGLLFETGYAENRLDDIRTPQGQGLYIITPVGRSGYYFVDSRQYAIRRQAIENVYLPVMHLAGVHRLQTGVDVDWVHYDAHLHRTAYEQYGLSGGLLSRTSFYGGSPIGVADREISAYFADSWQPREDLTIDAGVRFDHDSLVGDNAWSPRIGFSYAPFRSRKMKFSGGFAQTTDAAFLELFGRPQDEYAITTSFTNAGNPLAAETGSVYRLGRNLALPRARNWSFGFDREIAARTFAGVNFVRRRMTNGLTYAGNPEELLTLTNGDPASIFELRNIRRDSYDSVEFAIHQNLAAQFEWMASYTWSRAASNAVYDLSIDQPIRLDSNVGPQPWDSPHRLLSWGYLPLRWVPGLSDKWALAYLADARSGFPYSIQDETGRIVGDVNSRRFPVTFDLNLHLERRFLFRGYRFALRAGVNNATDTANASAINNVVGSPQFLQLLGREGRHVVLRIRFFGKA